MQELREDLDVILTMIMQDANVGAGMLKVTISVTVRMKNRIE